MDLGKILGREVTKEEQEKLNLFLEMIRYHSLTHNLVSKKDLSRLWDRHVVNCAYLVPWITAETWDLGSGAGFPGIILSIFRPEIRMGLVEIRKKKANFLRSVVSMLGLNSIILEEPIENLSILPPIVTARALAPLDVIFSLVCSTWNLTTKGFFLKGEKALKEVETAQKKWNFDYSIYPGHEGIILEVENLRKK